jgi:hypothetical protein
MQARFQVRNPDSAASGHDAGRSLTVTDVCLCLVPISLFLSIMSLV